MKGRLLVALCFLLSTALSGCGNGSLRGSTVPSKDGRTYLTVADDNGGACGPLLLDGKPWPYKINQPGLVSPGRHRIECGGWIEFDIPQGVVFKFDYWGP
jgi:hypothetical protein